MVELWGTACRDTERFSIIAGLAKKQQGVNSEREMPASLQAAQASLTVSCKVLVRDLKEQAVGDALKGRSRNENLTLDGFQA
jgi:hypothetical protein